MANLKDAMLSDQLSKSQQVLVLHEVSNKQELRHLVQSAGLVVPEEAKLAMFERRQKQKMIDQALKTETTRGRATDDKRSFVETNIVAGIGSPDKDEKFSKRLMAKTMGLSWTTGLRLFKNAQEKRGKIKKEEEEMSWVAVKKRKGFKKVSEELRKKLHDWFIKHPQVVASPFANDTLKIPDPEDPNQKIRAGKLLLQVSMRELHNDLLSEDETVGLKEARDENGKVLISDTALRCLRPPQVKPMTERHKVMCGCKICITIKQQQETLNLFHLRVLKSLDGKVASFGNNNRSRQKSAAEEKAKNYRNEICENDKHLHEKPKDAMKTIVCPFNDGFDLPHMRCTLRICEQCPKHRMPPLEQQLCQPCDENDEEQQTNDKIS